jgi:hypothetical protein
MIDLSPGDEMVFPAGSSARVRVVAKNGKRTRVAVDSEERIHVNRASQSNPTAQKLPAKRVARYGQHAI